MPLRVAIAISEADGKQAQKVLFEAYDKGELALRQMAGAKRTVERRERYGKAQSRPIASKNRPRNGPMTSPAASGRR